MKPHSPDRSAGFTLVEMLVVLLVLAVLASVAVLGVEDLGSQARFEATQRTLDRAREAILGDPHGDAPDPPCFVADIGRLPQASPDFDQSGAALSELWQRQGLPPYAITQPSGDSSGEALLGAGWRGPYLSPPVGSKGIRDGWSEPFELERPDGLPADVDDPIGRISSPGGPEPYNRTLQVTLDNGSDIRHDGQLSVTVAYDFTAAGSLSRLVLRVYGPEGGQAELLAQTTETNVPAEADRRTFNFNNGDDTSAGPIRFPAAKLVLAAYADDQASVTPATTDDLGTLPARLYQRLRLPRGGTILEMNGAISR